MDNQQASQTLIITQTHIFHASHKFLSKGSWLLLNFSSLLFLWVSFWVFSVFAIKSVISTLPVEWGPSVRWEMRWFQHWLVPFPPAEEWPAWYQVLFHSLTPQDPSAVSQSIRRKGTKLGQQSEIFGTATEFHSIKNSLFSPNIILHSCNQFKQTDFMTWIVPGPLFESWKAIKKKNSASLSLLTSLSCKATS